MRDSCETSDGCKCVDAERLLESGEIKCGDQCPNDCDVCETCLGHIHRSFCSKEPTVRNRGKSSKKAKSKADAKAPKSSKCSKAKSSSVDYVPLHTDNNYRQEMVNRDYWHPKNVNFQIIDWERWDTECSVKIPKVFDPPQRYNTKRLVPDDMYWWHRSKILFPGRDAWEASVKHDYALISDPSMNLFRKLLGPNPDSSSVPEPIRNKLFWMQYNDASEALVSFNRWAWRSNVKGGRSIGLGWMGGDWTNSPNVLGKNMTDATQDFFVNVQASPDEKWFKLAIIQSDPADPKAGVGWLDIYIVQEGDEFTDRDGNVLDYVKPGDMLRLTYGRIDPYDCEPEHLIFAYFPRTVAIIDEENGKITSNCPHYDALVETATSQPPEDAELATFGFTDASSMTLEERFDFQSSYVSDIQMFSSAATPPYGEDIEFES